MPEDGGLISQALIGLKPVNACGHTYTKPQTPSTRSRGLGWRIHESVEDTKLSTNKQHTLSARSVATGRCSTALTCGTTCPKTEPESSSRTAGRRVEHSRTWNEKATETLFSRKTPYTDLLFISHTRTVTPRYQPHSMTDSVTSHCITPTLFGQTGTIAIPCTG